MILTLGKCPEPPFKSYETKYVTSGSSSLFDVNALATRLCPITVVVVPSITKDLFLFTTLFVSETPVNCASSNIFTFLSSPSSKVLYGIISKPIANSPFGISIFVDTSKV